MKPKVRILGRTYKLLPEPEEGYYGQVSHWYYHITIDTTLCKDQQVQTLFHEAIHTISVATALDLKEKNVIRLTTGIVAFLTDNGVSLKPLEKLLKQIEG